MRRKTVDPTGKITVSKSDERYPYASEILMNHGFCIIFLNMSLGLLPVTIWGTRIKYFKCSISQMYTTLFCICFIFLSVIFVPICFFPKSTEQKSMTNLVILVSMGMLHTVGYICLLIRGHFVARKIPALWSQLSKLVQIAILDVYGTHCYLLKEARSYAWWAVGEYFFIMITTTGSMIAFGLDYSDGIQESIAYYKLNIFVWPPGPDQNAFRVFQWWTFHVGYFIWQLCSSCHVLVTMFLCYMVIVITVCLKSVNQQIVEFKDQIMLKRRNQGLATSSNIFGVPRIQFSENRGVSHWDEERIIERLDTVSKVVLITEKITQSISLMWGISLIVEALILIAAGTVNAYDFLAMFRQHGESEDGSDDGIMKFTIPDIDEWIGIFVTVSTHFFFLFKLTTRVNIMIDEAKNSLHLLKQIPCHYLPQAIREKVNDLKHDFASASINITASNFFQVNKFLITSITSQIATYVIVLLQFAQQEINSSKPEGEGDDDATTLAV